MQLTVLVRQTREPNAPVVRYIASSRVQLSDQYDIDMRMLGIDTGSEQLVVWNLWKPGRWIFPYNDLFPSWVLNDLIWSDSEFGPTITVVARQDATYAMQREVEESSRRHRAEQIAYWKGLFTHAIHSTFSLLDLTSYHKRAAALPSPIHDSDGDTDSDHYRPPSLPEKVSSLRQRRKRLAEDVK